MYKRFDRSNIQPRFNGIDNRLDKFGQLYKYDRLLSCFVYTCPDAKVMHSDKVQTLVQKAQA